MKIQPVEVVNTHEQLVRAGGGWAIVTSVSPGRGHNPSGWAIYRVSASGAAIQTDPSAPWYDHGRKTFQWFGFIGTPAERRAAALDAAKRWVSLQINGYVGPWTRNRMRDYVPTDINRRFPIRKVTR